MTAIDAIGFSIFVIIVLGLAVAFAFITRSIRQEEAGWTFSGIAPSRSTRLTRRMLGAYCDSPWDPADTHPWADAPRPEHDQCWSARLVGVAAGRRRPTDGN